MRIEGGLQAALVCFKLSRSGPTCQYETARTYELNQGARTSMQEIKPLTSLRAFAAFLVFMFHYANVFSPANRGVEGFAGEWIPLLPLWKQGSVGVSIFFVLSGFLISRIYYDQVAGGTISLRLYFVKRIARIWPLFLVFGTIQHVWLALTDQFPGDGVWVTMTMTQGLFEQLRYTGLPTAWSLTVEETFYAVAPPLYLLISRLAPIPAEGVRRRDGARLAFVLIGVVLGAALCGELVVRGAAAANWSWQGFMGSRYHMWHSTLFGRLPEFAIGMGAAFVHRAGVVPRLFAGRRAPGVIVAMFLGMGACMWGKTLLVDETGVAAQGGTYLLAYLLAGMSAVLILALSVRGNVIERLLSHGLLVYLGKISYGFYLIQITVMIAPLVALTDHLGFARLPVLFVLTNLFCAASYELVEKPTRRLIVARWGLRP